MRPLLLYRFYVKEDIGRSRRRRRTFDLVPIIHLKWDFICYVYLIWDISSSTHKNESTKASIIIYVVTPINH